MGILIKIISSVCCIMILMTIFGYIASYFKKETFDKDGIAFLEYGDTKYGLRGDKLDTRNVTNCYYDKRICYDNTFGDTEHNTYKY